MADQTPEEINAALMATAATYNTQNPTGDTEADAAAQAAAHALKQATGSQGHDGTPEVHADTPEEIAAADAKKAEEEAAAKAEKDKEDAEKAKDTETPEAKAEREKNEAAAQEEADKSDWMSSDSKEFNAAISLMKAAGMKPAEAAKIFDDAAQTGDMTKVDQAALVEAVGEDKAALIMAGFTTYVQTEGAAILERVSKVHDAVGGTENFAVMSKWAREKAKGDPAFRKVVTDITATMNSGNEYQAELAAKDFLSRYNADTSNTTINPGAATEVDVTAAKLSPAASTATPITARDFAEKSEEIIKTKRGADQKQALDALSRDRAAGRSKGI